MCYILQSTSSVGDMLQYNGAVLKTVPSKDTQHVLMVKIASENVVTV